MKFSLFYFPQLGMGDPTSHERGCIGNDPDQYAYLLEDLKAQAQLAEDLGFWSMYFAEHHFDVEGFEMAHNPILFDAWVAMNTRKIHVGQLGLVLPNWNPLRLAEDIATMAHMFGDRFEIGFARGFQTREVAPLAAAHQVEGALSDQSEADKRNRRLFSETYEILMKALTQDFFHHEGEFYTIPPKDLKWMNPATQKYGGGVAPDGAVTDLAVVPKLPGRRLPTRWQAFSFSEETIRFAGREGMNAAFFEIKAPQQRYYEEIFQQEAEAAGHKRAYGEGVGYVRGGLCLPDADEAHRYNRAAVDKLWGEWFAGTGFTQAFKLPSDPPDQWLEYSYEMTCERGFDFTGDPDHFTRQLEALYENTKMEHFIVQYNTGGVPRDILLRSLETLAEKVMPRFDVESAPEPAVVASGSR